MSTDMNKLKESAEEIIRTLVNKEIFTEDQVKIQEVIKNNDTEKYGILVKINETVSPIVYVDYLVGMTMSEICDKFQSMITNPNVVNMDEVAMVKRFMEQDDPYPVIYYIFPRLINKERNKRYLKKHPYTEFLDLAVVYDIRLNDSAIISITDEIIKHFNIKKDCLDKIARANFENHCINDVTIKSIGEVIKALVSEESAVDLDEPYSNMYVVSTKSQIQGSVSIIFDDVLRRIEYVLGTSEFYILPSSVHEVIVLVNNSITTEELKRIVKEINEAIVITTEVLSDNIYRYVKGKGVEIVL